MIRKRKLLFYGTVLFVAVYVLGYVGQYRFNVRYTSVVGNGSFFPISYDVRIASIRSNLYSTILRHVYGSGGTANLTENVEIMKHDTVNTIPASKSTERGFQTVDDKTQIYVYSAYFDNRDKPIIRVLVITKFNLALDMFQCVPVDLPGAVYDATLEFIPEPGNWRYLNRGGIINCFVKDNQKPKFISVVLKSSQNDPNLSIRNNTKHLLEVNYPGDKPLRNITRCVPSLYNFTDTTGLVQMIESDRLFGMEHFIFYNYTGLSPAVNALLESYQKEGIVTVKKWNLPVNPKTIHYYGQMTNSHECLYHNMLVSKYVFLADVDEIVVSEVFNSWQNLCDATFRNNPKCGAISFKNAFFPTSFGDTKTDFDVKQDAIKLKLTFLTKTVHTQIKQIGDRSKLLTKPETIRFLWIHAVDTFYNKSSTTCPINSPRDALLHHYRFKRAPDMNPPLKEDTSIFKYSKQLVDRVTTRLASIKVL